MTRTFAFTALAAFSAITMAPAAMAQDGQSSREEGNSVTVYFADLNLNHEAGVEIFDRRIRNAARQVCGQPASNALFGGPVRLCIRETIAAVQETRDEVIMASRSNEQRILAFSSITISRGS